MSDQSLPKRLFSTIRCFPCAALWLVVAGMVIVSFALELREGESTAEVNEARAPAQRGSQGEDGTGAAPPDLLPPEEQPESAKPPIAKNALGREIAVPPPYPIISEVYFEVLTPLELADANGDGVRSATGDEFVEIWNPHGEAVNLEGYTITDRNPEPERRWRFVFPAVELGPGEVAVVFNGRGWSPDERVGTEQRAPSGPHPGFHGAWVFTVNAPSREVALSNEAEFVLLSAAEGKPIDCVAWGDPEPGPPSGALRLNVVSADPAGSVQRLAPAGPLLEHANIDQTPFSPGRIPTVSD